MFALQVVDLGREIGVLFGEPARVVGREGEGDFVPADVDVGVVIRVFGEVGDFVDELDGGREALELEGLRNGFAVESPTLEGGEVVGDRGVGEEVGHAPR